MKHLKQLPTPVLALILVAVLAIGILYFDDILQEGGRVIYLHTNYMRFDILDTKGNIIAHIENDKIESKEIKIDSFVTEGGSTPEGALQYIGYWKLSGFNYHKNYIIIPNKMIDQWYKNEGNEISSYETSIYNSIMYKYSSSDKPNKIKFNPVFYIIQVGK